MALSNERKAEVEEKLLQGYTAEETAEKLGVGLATVKRIKKRLAETEPELTEIIKQNKYNRILQEREEKYLKKIEKEKELFEDVEEGWVYHKTAEEMKAAGSGKWWSFIIYPESAPEDWKKRMDLLGIEWACSPEHDKDTWDHDSPEEIDEKTGEVIKERGARYKAGTPKKEHIHGLAKFPTVKSYKEANHIIRAITNGPYIQKCMSLKGAYEYFTHVNHPNKYQYEKSEIEKHNGFIVEATESDRIILLNEIGKVIAKEGLESLEEVRAYYEDQYEYIQVIASRSYYVEKLTQCVWRKKNPEGRTQKVRVLKENEI